MRNYIFIKYIYIHTEYVKAYIYDKLTYYVKIKN
jgi:hypothetical protein